jgi:hypothetical protein
MLLEFLYNDWCLKQHLRRDLMAQDGIFPNPDPYLRLVVTYLMEYAEDRSVSKAYIAEDTIAETLKPAA